MKSLAFYFGLSVGLIFLNSSCGQETINSSEKLLKQDTVELNTQVKSDEIKPIEKKKTENETGFLTDFKPFLSEDSLLLDSAFIETITTFPFLNSEYVRSFEAVLIDKKLSEYNHRFLNDYFMLDSIKRNHQYSDYLSKISLGQVQESVANALYQIELQDGSILLLWSLTHSSYEADPFTYGTEIYATSYINDVAKQTILVAEAVYSMDPPMFYLETIYANYANNVFSLKKHIESGEQQDEENVVYEINTRSSFKIRITENKFSLK
jgi:hypothetical protein